MGFFDEISSLLGGGPNNQSFVAQAPATLDQTQAAYQNAQTGLTQQQQLINALQGQNGLGNQSAVFNQLQGVANGTGPNPAQAMLANATGQNVANQAALMAGQRGAGANAGLIARQAAQQGAATQQNAIGQGAALQANQSLGALGQMGGLANQQAANQINATQGYNQLAQGEQGQLLGDIGNQNKTNEDMAKNNANNSAQTIQGIAGAGSKAVQSLAAADGGLIEKDRVVSPEGDNPKLAQVPQSDRFPSSVKFPPHLQMVSDLYHGGKAMKSGGVVPGKAEVQGNSPKNDTVPTMLSPGEVVIPKSVMESDDPAGGAAKFVAALAKKNGKAPEGEFKEALKRAIAGRKSK